ncbi:MAG: hypothetical protein HZA90_14450 [Verrucomicrobia bacterium]|nr:hypothetical protein [Verrucomicrobiota bacterium]
MVLGTGYAVRHRPRLASGEPAAERDSLDDGALMGRLREAILRLDPTIISKEVLP